MWFCKVLHMAVHATVMTHLGVPPSPDWALNAPAVGLAVARERLGADVARVRLSLGRGLLGAVEHQRAQKTKDGGGGSDRESRATERPLVSSLRRSR